MAAFFAFADHLTRTPERFAHVAIWALHLDNPVWSRPGGVEVVTVPAVRNDRPVGFEPDGHGRLLAVPRARVAVQRLRGPSILDGEQRELAGIERQAAVGESQERTSSGDRLLYMANVSVSAPNAPSEPAIKPHLSVTGSK